MIMNWLFRKFTGMAINHNWIILLMAATLLLTITNDIRPVRGIELTEISVPEVADVKDTVNLTCTYHMGKHKLNSVKWYKDTMEFFRYAPLMTPAILTFPVVGIALLRDQAYICNSHTCTISLEQLESRTSGSYRCEVSGDAPEFKLDSQTANMTIAALPGRDPLITGLADYYEDGDLVSVNCTTDMSSPAASITWYINGERVNSDYPNSYHEENIVAAAFQLQSRSLELHFHIDRHRHLQDDRHTLELKCSAKVDGLPSVQPRETIRFVSLKQDDLSNQKLNAFSASESGQGSVHFVGQQRHSMTKVPLLLLQFSLSVLVVTLITATQLS